MNFVEVESGLYLFRNRAHAITNNKMSGYSYLMLTEANMKNFTDEQIRKAQRARDLYRGIGFPGYKKFLWMLKNNKLSKSGVTWDDAKRALHIYGEEVATIKGKTVQKVQTKTQCVNRVTIPKDILQNHNKVHIMVDHMFVQGVQFLTTVSHKLKFRTAEALQHVYKKGAKKEDMLRGINKVINLYQARGLEVETIHADNEYECLREELRPVTLNITAADQHVSMIERSIRTVKDRTRSQIQFLPYTKYPRNMIVGCVIFSMKMLNNEVGMSKLLSCYSPHTSVTGQPPPTYDNLSIMSYGDYAEVYAANGIKTVMKREPQAV